jgi:hypothetical protein
MIDGRWKAIVRRDLPVEGPRNQAPMGLAAVKLPELDIFDLQADMADAKSLVAERQDHARSAQKRLAAWLSEMDALHAKYGDSGPSAMTPEAAANLRALGYLK